MLTKRTALRSVLASLAICFIALGALAQPTVEQVKANMANASYQQKFESGVGLMQDGYYAQAKVIWENLLEQDAENANLNYKMASCIVKMGDPVETALPFYEKASRGIVKKYNPFSMYEDGAPREVHYYMGYSAHRKGDIEKAEDEYLLFLDLVSPKHELTPKAQMGLDQIKVARKLIANPEDYDIINLGPVVNTANDEYSPVVTIDGSNMFFTTKREREDGSNKKYLSPQDGKHYEDIYITVRDEMGGWTKPELLNISTPDRNEATVSSNADGSEIFLYISDLETGSNVYRSSLFDTIFTSPDMIDRPINSENWEPHVSMSTDGNLVFFTSDRPGGYGGRDIYRIKKMANGQWSDPLNLGPTVNTPYDEDSPFIGADSKTLYFASNGPKSMGGFDMFVTQLDEEGQWSMPKNMGAPLNTFDDDIFYSTTADGLTGFYASNKEGGFGGTDIYMIRNRESLISGVAILKGYVRTYNGGKLPPGVEIYVTNLTDGDKTRTFRPKLRDGSYVFNLKPCHQYLAEYKYDGEIFYSTEVEVPCNSSYHEINKEIFLNLLTLKGTEKGYEVTYNPMDIPHWELHTLDETKEFRAVRIEVMEDGKVFYDEDVVNKFGQFVLNDLQPGSDYELRVYRGYEPICEGYQLIEVDGHGGVLRSVDMDEAACGFSFTQEALLAMADGTNDSGTDTNDGGNDSGQDGGNDTNDGGNDSGQEGGNDTNDGGNDSGQDGGNDTNNGGNDSGQEGGNDTNDGGNDSGQDGGNDTNDGGNDSGQDGGNDTNDGGNDSRQDSGNDTNDGGNDSGQDAGNDTNDGGNDSGQDGGNDNNDGGNDSGQDGGNDTNDGGNELASNDGSNSSSAWTTAPSFEEHFGYNKNAIKAESDFQSFMKSVKERVEAGEQVTITIEASASKVPTRTFTNNKELAGVRADRTKDRIVRWLETSGVNKDLVHLETEALVQGPSYNYDHDKNLRVYVKYQYVKLKAR